MDFNDLIEALRAEVVSVQADLAASFEAIAAGQGEAEESRSSYVTLVERIEATAALIGLKGLETCCKRVNESILALNASDSTEAEKWREYFEGWLSLVEAYLGASDDMGLCILLASHIGGGPRPVQEDLIALLAAQLAEKPEASQELTDALGPERATVAEDADVSLELPPDLDQNLFDGFMQEAPDWATELSSLAAKLSSGTLSSEGLREAKRIAHTFKGSANIVGIIGIARIAHHLEDILEYLQDNPGSMPSGLTDALIDAAGCLEQMVFFLLGQEELPADARDILQVLLDWANRIDRDEMHEADTAISSRQGIAGSESFLDALMADEKADALLPATRPIISIPVLAKPIVPVTAVDSAPGKNTSAELAVTEQALRISVKTVDDLVRLTGELSIKIGQFQARIKQTTQRAQLVLTQNLIVQKRVFEIENLVDVRGLATMRSRGDTAGRNMAVSGVVGTEVFDPLEMDEYNQLHSVTRALVEETTDSRELSALIEEDIAQLTATLHQQERLQRDLQHMVMTTRMTPVKSIVPRLQRTVRQTCQATDKQAGLIVEGAETLLDGDILAKLADPLLHILRNAIDHGIEAPGDRSLLGKPAAGLITLAFAREGQALVLRCSDDGCGLDFAAIHAKAINRGLLAENQPATDAELARMIMLPGFSTRDSVSEISGRGVGLDVVRSRIMAMKGNVEIRSAGSGQGTTITMRIPASLLAMHVLLAESAGQVFGLPSYNIENALAPDEAELIEIGEQPHLQYRGAVYPAWSLAQLIGMGAGNIDAKTQCAVLMRVDDKRTAVMVDKVIDAREVISKEMGTWVKGALGLSGAAILGDGSVAPLLDVADMLREPELRVFNDDMALLDAGRQQTAMRVLVVDDSLSVRRTLTQLIEDSGYAVETAKDGLEAIRTIDSFHPHVVLTDMEMPNMNGLELTTHLRERNDTRDVPIIMITSRSQEKHRRQAEHAGVSVYMTKPYAENELIAHIQTMMEDRRHAAAAA